MGLSPFPPVPQSEPDISDMAPGNEFGTSPAYDPAMQEAEEASARVAASLKALYGIRSENQQIASMHSMEEEVSEAARAVEEALDGLASALMTSSRAGMRDEISPIA